MRSVLVLSIVRTILPFVYGLIVAALVKVGFELDPAQQDGLTAWLTANLEVIIGSLLYVVARLIERHAPSLALISAALLGSKKSPDAYSEDTVPGEVVSVETIEAADEDTAELGDDEFVDTGARHLA